MLIKSIEEKTEKLLLEYNLLQTPIDVSKLAIDMGIDIEPADLEYDVSGFFVIKNNTPYIRFNKLEKLNRQRFTIAHELGHYVLHSKDTSLFVDKMEKLLYRDADSATGNKAKEREANSFAASLLMPKVLILKVISNLKHDTDDEDFVYKLAKIFNVSESAMAIRLANLGLLEFGL